MAPHPPPRAEPSLEDFMTSDASFLTELRKRGQEVAEDFVAFELYATEGAGGHKESGPGQQRAALAERVAARVLQVTETYRAAYMWHHEAFAFSPHNDDPPFSSSSSSTTTATTTSPLLRGRVRVGENVEDEWFVVWLLRLATADPELAALGLTARVWDADGDFLLIEAALVMPDWLGPENSMFRVWIQGGRLHFLSEVHHPLTASTEPLTAQRALQLLASSSSPSSSSFSSSSTVAPWLNQALEERLIIYPGAIKGSKHRAACYLPLSVAALLRERPALVSAAVRALRSREPGELLGMMKGGGGGGGGREGGGGGEGGLRFEPRPLVPVSVIFSRYLFGQVEADELQPPKAYLTAIADLMVGGGRKGGKGGGREEEEEEVGRDRVKAAVARGVRLACGLEMLYWRSKRGWEGEGGREGGEGGEGGEWTVYVAQLRGMGFWDGVMEGSKEYRERTMQAKNAFEETRRNGGGGGGGEGGGGGRRGGEGKKKMCEIMNEILPQVEGELNLEDFPKGLTELPADDDEEWMEVVPGELDKLLEKYGQPLEEDGGEGGMLFEDEEEEEDSEEEEEEEGGRKGGGEDLKSMVEGMKHFIGAMAGLEGAEVTGGRAASSSNSSSSSSSVGGGRSGKKGEDVSFDVSRLLDILEGRDIEKALREGMMMGGREGEMVDSDDGEEEEEEERGYGREGPMKGRVYMREGNAKGRRGRDSDDEDDSDDEEEDDAREKKEEEKEAMEAYMVQMERELRGTTLAKTFDRVSSAAQGAAAGCNSRKRDKQEEEAEYMDEDEELPPVDVDLNLVRHLLESVAAQGSLPGPASNMLGEVWKSMGAE